MIGYQYDKNGNRLKTLLPNQSAINYHYYGSGHLSAIKYNDRLITEFSRDKLHREISRTQGNLISQFKHDPLGRLEQQLARLENHPTSGEIIRRNYQYDQVGNLTETDDLRTGRMPYRYDKLGQLQLAGQELFHFDLAHNLIEKETQRIENNQVMYYQGISYGYDEFGNLSERIFPSGEVQRYKYNAKDKLIEASIQKPNQGPEVWEYGYDVLGRRINKRLKNGENLQNTAETRFIWDGSHLVQEIHKSDGKNGTENDRTYSYIYTHPSSYEPLAQLEFVKNETNPTACTTYYYHTDQIGIPRELTDESGKLCWYGDYSGWGKLKNNFALKENIHQPFRLQNQYFDQETGLHYNFFRYYEPNVGRFTQLDPIGLLGGENLYEFAPNVNGWADPLGLWKYHGNWCGPDWTGGRAESYGKERDHNGYYSAPISQLDSACKQHDICYAQCREAFRCNGDGKESCMEKCDDNLVLSSRASTDDVGSTPTERRRLELVIERHLGTENQVERNCPNYYDEILKNIKLTW